MNTQTKTDKQKLEADKIYSTFWWEIELDHSHPRNYNKNVKTLFGYSKFQGHDEAKDKKQMLMRKILMLATNGYLERSKWIIIYQRGGTLVNKSQDRIVCTLFEKTFEIPIERIGKMATITKFLVDLYEHINTGKNIKHLLPKPTPTFSKDDFFDITNYHFPSQTHLYAWAEKKIKDGHSFEIVQNFVRKYMEKGIFVGN